MQFKLSTSRRLRNSTKTVFAFVLLGKGGIFELAFVMKIE